MISADKPGTYLGQCAEYCGLSHANMRFRVIAQTPTTSQDWLAEPAGGPGERALRRCRDGTFSSEPAPQLIEKFQCTNCHTFDDSSSTSYGPNLTHLASRTTFASGYYELTHANLVSWMLERAGDDPDGVGGLPAAPVPQGDRASACRSFTENTPKGQTGR